MAGSADGENDRDEGVSRIKEARRGERERRRKRRRENKKFVEKGVEGEGEEQTINRTMDSIRERGREFSCRFYI